MNKISWTTFHSLNCLLYYVHTIPSLLCYCSEACFLVANHSFDFTGFYNCPVVTSKEEMDYLSFSQKKLAKVKKWGILPAAYDGQLI